MARQVRGGEGRIGFQRCGECPVRLGALPRQQIPQQNLPEQLMTERVSGLVGDHHPCAYRRAQQVIQRCAVMSGDSSQ